eukprot:TRINITY_DN12315_c0_g1_i1.p1 TRINITY_DN12315_c0_g1~~TRINITY_DN12315_c0_g1_i1.p1  ORF type:complete len:218 (+),score=18.08 TRINITY_DN12315_c0_g1_i1:338-991(+)
MEERSKDTIARVTEAVNLLTLKKSPMLAEIQYLSDVDNFMKTLESHGEVRTNRVPEPPVLEYLTSTPSSITYTVGQPDVRIADVLHIKEMKTIQYTAVIGELESKSEEGKSDFISEKTFASDTTHFRLDGLYFCNRILYSHEARMSMDGVKRVRNYAPRLEQKPSKPENIKDIEIVRYQPGGPTTLGGRRITIQTRRRILPKEYEIIMTSGVKCQVL